MREIVVTVNSPGEVATWLEPVARELVPRLDGAYLTVMIPPCTFASGAEAAAVRDLLGGSERVRVYDPGQVLAYLLARRVPPGYRPASQGVVLFLGGDMVYAAWLARRLGYRALAYTEGRVRWIGVFERFLLPDASALARARARLGSEAPRMEERLEVVGDLMIDAARSRVAPETVRERLGLGPAEQMLLLLPGSRAAEFRFLIPLYLDALARLARIPAPEGEPPALRAVFALSPFADGEVAARLALERLQASGLPAPAGEKAAPKNGWETFGIPGGRRLTLLEAGWPGAIRSLRVELVRGASRELMAAADMALTIPGSNTAEMAAFGLPMLVVLPLQRPEEIPLEGLPGLVGGIPGLGPAIKRRAVRRAVEATPLVALPNRKAGRAVVPELRGEVGPDEIGEELAAWLDDAGRRSEARRNLEALKGEPGAARRVVDHIVKLFAAESVRPAGRAPADQDHREVVP